VGTFTPAQPPLIVNSPGELTGELAMARAPYGPCWSSQGSSALWRCRFGAAMVPAAVRSASS
jgi:hypothetical protein